MLTVSLVDKLLHGPESEKLATIDQLQSNLEPTVKNALVSQLNKLPEQETSELRSALINAIDNIEQKGSMYKATRKCLLWIKSWLSIITVCHWPCYHLWCNGCD
ncbi:hypothetical protein ACLKMH_06925 [Psychromonas sp. KJ10-10]|uniref:hypothetical protein n=1 Tax=Psychromonas sp. KJ10-10 TaxID=3391823 RepID=UPI0039B4B32F